MRGLGRGAGAPRPSAVLVAAALVVGAGPRAPAQTDDPGFGARVFQRCYACHSVEPGEHHTQGPNLRDVFGRRAGTLAGFEYSGAMIEAGRARGIVWNGEALDAFLADPNGYAPGTSMAFVGLRDPRERAAIIGYLKGSAE